MPTLGAAPAHPFANTMLRTFDTNVSYPIHWKKLPEYVSLEPTVAIYNVFNFANYDPISSTATALETVANAPTAEGNPNGPSGYQTYNSVRVSRKTGTFDQGAPRSTEFQLKLNF